MFIATTFTQSFFVLQRCPQSSFTQAHISLVSFSSSLYHQKLSNTTVIIFLSCDVYVYAYVWLKWVVKKYKLSHLLYILIIIKLYIYFYTFLHL